MNSRPVPFSFPTMDAFKDQETEQEVHPIVGGVVGDQKVLFLWAAQKSK